MTAHYNLGYVVHLWKRQKVEIEIEEDLAKQRHLNTMKDCI